MSIDRGTGTALVQGLAARGHIIGDTRTTGDSGGVYAAPRSRHRDAAGRACRSRVPVEVDAAVARRP